MLGDKRSKARVTSSTISIVVDLPHPNYNPLLRNVSPVARRQRAMATRLGTGTDWRIFVFCLAISDPILSQIAVKVLFETLR